MTNHPWERRQVAFRRTIKKVRVRAGLTQTELAAQLSRPQSYISKYESGDRRLDYLETREICACCGVSIAAFDRMLLQQAKHDRQPSQKWR